MTFSEIFVRNANSWLIQSFDSRFDEGLVLANNNVQTNFTNFTAEENLGKNIFLDPPPNGGAGCAGCHRPPEFDIDPVTRNNGVIAVAGSATEIDLTNTRSPSLRDVFDQDGDLNGPLMHNGNFITMLQVINHYDAIPNNPANTNLDPRLLPGGQPQVLNLTTQEKNALIAFMKTLTGTAVYTDERWSNPFEPDGSITIIGGNLGINNSDNSTQISLYPNPAYNQVTVQLEEGNYTISVFNTAGKQLVQTVSNGSRTLDISTLNSGIYFVAIQDIENNIVTHKKLIKQ